MRKNRSNLLKEFNFGPETWIYIVLSLLLGFSINWINSLFFPYWFSPVGKQTIISILSAVASGMITLSGIVFSLFFVLFQFGSSSYSPRLVRIFTHSIILRHSLGIFTGTFLYSLMAMRTIGIESTDRVSGLVVWIAFAWLIVSIAVLVRLIQVFTTMNITNILTALSVLGRNSIERTYHSIKGDKNETGNDFTALLKSDTDTIAKIYYEGEPGYITGFNRIALIATAKKTDSIILIPYSIGDALKDGAVLAYVKNRQKKVDEGSIYESIQLGVERIFRNDPKYPIRLLVDTAIRALSPAVNDPTTAVQVLDHLEPLLRSLGNLKLDIGIDRDLTGQIRLVYKTPSWEDYLLLALSEIMQYGASSIQVQRRLAALLEFLEQVLPQKRAETVKKFSLQRETVANISFQNTPFLTWANIPDREGIGSASDGWEGLA